MLYREMNHSDLVQELASMRAEYESLCTLGLKLDLSRGKPEPSQTAFSDGLVHTLDDGNFIMDGIDARNYGQLAGLPSCRKLMAEMLLCRPEQVICSHSASLNIMYDLISKAYTHGLLHSVKPWSRESKVRFLCPYPGYDRHFNLSLAFGMELIPVPMDENGPDMNMVEQLVSDPSVKGMWCVPKFSNPDGYVYPLETLERIAALTPAAPDFMLMWDNAYCIHTFEGEDLPFPDMLAICDKAGHADMVYEFASTSKVTFAGAGVACVAASEDNVAYLLSLMKYQTIGPNKINELMHVRFLQDREGLLKIMKRHASVLKPKFDAVLHALDEKIAPCAIATWHKPKGGYFISLNAMPGTAKRTLELCKAAGVTMTGAGATYPGGVDPEDSNIRIAPSYPPLEELRAAIDVFCVCLRLAALEKLTA